MILVQATICQYYMCTIYVRCESFPVCNFCMTNISKVLVFLNFVYIPMAASSTGTSSTGSTPYHTLHFDALLYYFATCKFQSFVIEKLPDTKDALIREVFWCETLLLWFWRNYVTTPPYWWSFFLWSLAISGIIPYGVWGMKHDVREWERSLLS